MAELQAKLSSRKAIQSLLKLAVRPSWKWKLLISIKFNFIHQTMNSITREIMSTLVITDSRTFVSVILTQLSVIWNVVVLLTSAFLWLDSFGWVMKLNFMLIISRNFSNGPILELIWEEPFKPFKFNHEVHFDLCKFYLVFLSLWS